MKISRDTKDIFMIGASYIVFVNGFFWLLWLLFEKHLTFYKFYMGLGGYTKGGAFGTIHMSMLLGGAYWLYVLIKSILKDFKRKEKHHA